MTSLSFYLRLHAIIVEVKCDESLASLATLAPLTSLASHVPLASPPRSPRSPRLARSNTENNRIRNMRNNNGASSNLNIHMNYSNAMINDMVVNTNRHLSQEARAAARPFSLANA